MFQRSFRVPVPPRGLGKPLPAAPGRFQSSLTGSMPEKDTVMKAGESHPSPGRHLLEAVPAPKSLGSGRSASARPRKAERERTSVAHPPRRENNEPQTGRAIG